MVLVLLSGVRLWDGRAGDAVEPAQEAVRLFRGLTDLRGQSMAFGTLARALAAAGRADEALATLDEAAEVLTPGFTEDLSFIRGGVLTHLGLVDEFTASLAWYAESKVFAADMVRSNGLTLFGLAELQMGRAAEATAHLKEAVELAVADGPKANALSVLALCHVATGCPDAARDAAAAALEIDTRTYLDSMYALVARGFASVQAGDVAGAEAAFSAAQDAVDGTSDRVQQAAVRLAHGLAWSALGLDSADAVLDEARGRLGALGLDGAGWEQVFRLAASGSGTAAMSAAEPSGSG
jgi:tetratricopeptide (TPR) repeat protein